MCGKTLQIVELAREHGRVTMRDAIKLAGGAAILSSSISGRWLRKATFVSREKGVAPGMNCVEAA